MDNTTLADELEAALKLLDNVTATDSTADDLGCAELAIGRALAALRTPAPAPVSGKPVAWMYTPPSGPGYVLKRIRDPYGFCAGWTETPLYAALQAQPAQAQGDVVERARRIKRTAEMSANIMRDTKRTGGWEGAEKTASAFDRLAKDAEALRAALAAMQQAPMADDGRPSRIAKKSHEKTKSGDNQ
jgi:hypothetical protein